MELIFDGTRGLRTTRVGGVQTLADVFCKAEKIDRISTVEEM
jgi:hypothetical protein